MSVDVDIVVVDIVGAGVDIVGVDVVDVVDVVDSNRRMSLVR